MERQKHGDALDQGTGAAEALDAGAFVSVTAAGGGANPI
jgi:hypothetical protein